MTEKHPDIKADHGSVAAHTHHGDVTVNNTYPIQSGLTEQDATEKKEKEKESHYLSWVIADCGGLEWLSLMEYQEGEGGMELGAVYTALLTNSRQADKTRPDAAQDEMERMHRRGNSIRQGRLSAVELLNQEHKLVLLGDPGSGKSAFVNFVSLCLAGQQLDKVVNLDVLTEPLPDNSGRPESREIASDGKDEEGEPKSELVRQTWDHGALIPLKIILRDFAASDYFPGSDEKATAKHLLKFLKQDFTAKGFAGYVKILKNRLQNGRVLVMFDGMDEVAQAGDRRKQLVACIDAFSKSFSQCRFLVTCRPYAYRDRDWQLPGFAVGELAEFEKGQVIRFIERWYQQLPSLDRKKSVARGELLQHAVLGRPALDDLAKRPLLLSLIAYLHAYRHGLPDRRADLYEKLLDLLVDKWEKARFEVNDDDINQARKLSQASLAEYLQMGQDAILNVLKRLAFDAHASQDGDQDTADISATDLHGELLREADGCGNREVRIFELSEHLRDRVGILYQRSGSTETDAVYTFPHRSFQEYLSAEYFRLEKNVLFERFESADFMLEDYTWQELAAKLGRRDPDRWREVVVLAGGIHAESDPGSVWSLLRELSARQDAAVLTQEEAWGLRLASEIVAESVALGDMNPRQRRIFKKIQTALPEVLSTPHLDVKERVDVGRYLGRIGDPRPEVMGVDAMRFCYVPKGEFWMGRGKYESDDDRNLLEERPAGNYDLSYDYWIAQSPVSVAQFKIFVEESGFKIGDDDALKGAGNSPVAWVSQQEALAFCEWLTQRWHDAGILAANLKVSLPNEPEWEKAARGGLEIPSLTVVKSVSELASAESPALQLNSQVQRRYPWGNEVTSEQANYGGKAGGVTTRGIYPSGVSPYGCHDLSGNVWEWTRSEQGDYPYPAVGTEAWKQREGTEPTRCVLRGGAFNYDQNYVRCAFRFLLRPDYRSHDFGFRVVLSPLL